MLAGAAAAALVTPSAGDVARYGKKDDDIDPKAMVKEFRGLKHDLKEQHDEVRRWTEKAAESIEKTGKIADEVKAGLEEASKKGEALAAKFGELEQLVAKLSANENARYIARIYGLDPDYVSAFCRWLCDIGEYFDQPVGVYSSGMRSRLTFALLLALEFDIYLIDEGMPATTDVNFNRKAGGVLLGFAGLAVLVGADAVRDVVAASASSWMCLRTCSLCASHRDWA